MHAKYLKGIFNPNYKHQTFFKLVAHIRLYFHIFSKYYKQIISFEICRKKVFEGDINFYFTLILYFNNNNLIESFRPFSATSGCWMLDDACTMRCFEKKSEMKLDEHKMDTATNTKVCTLHDMLHFTTYTLLIAITHVCVCILAPHANYLHKCSTKEKKERSDVFT